MGGCGVVPAMARLRHTDLASNEKALLAHAGLKPDEFDALHRHFDEAWQAYIRYYTLGREAASAAEQRGEEQHLAHDRGQAPLRALLP